MTLHNSRTRQVRGKPWRALNALVLFAVMTLALLAGSCLRANCQALTPGQALFLEVWNDFSLSYSYFEYKDIDWEAVKDDSLDRFKDRIDGETFAWELNRILSELH
ncbi:MAG: hypothetical protein D6E12_04525, partial [Desulfovibrio sp.]